MFLHIGGDTVVHLDEVVAILDARSVDGAESTREFLSFMRSTGRVRDTGAEEAKAYVICDDRVFVSPISAQTLRRRAGLLEAFV